MFNVVNPDHIVEDYGADTLRMYEMFLGPLEQSKPWDTNGIDGVHKFLRRFWRLFFDRDGKLMFVGDEVPTPAELKTLHKTIKKVGEDIENFSFNTSVSAFMICLNELGPCNKRAILEPLVVLLAPFAPHIAEELWESLGHTRRFAMPLSRPMRSNTWSRRASSIRFRSTARCVTRKLCRQASRPKRWKQPYWPIPPLRNTSTAKRRRR